MSEPIPTVPPGEPLVEYIRANGDRYNREVLTNLLIREGHAPADVAEAWRSADATAAADPGVEPTRTRQTVLAAIAILLAIGALAIGEFALLAVSGGRLAMLVYVVLYPIQLVMVTRWIVGRIRASGALRSGDLAMTVGWLVLPVIAIGAVMGVCFGYGGAFGCFLDC